MMFKECLFQAKKIDGCEVCFDLRHLVAVNQHPDGHLVLWFSPQKGDRGGFASGPVFLVEGHHHVALIAAWKICQAD